MPDTLIAVGSSEGVSPLLAHTLLELFSLEPSRGLSEEAGAADRRSLWTADALHRANNLAQMSSSLESTRVRRRHGLPDCGAGARARALSRAYAELGAYSRGVREVPCASLLEVIVTKLVELFAGERPVRALASLDEVALPADKRRALILIASELVINALKYAFPPGEGGTITVTLIRLPDRIELCVADDGVGLGSFATAGHGNGLMARLGGLLDANICHLSSETGLKVVVSMPIQPM